MNETVFDNLIEQLKKQLDSSKQNWLFGAGISAESNIPLMYPLTERVQKMISLSDKIKNQEIYKLLSDCLDEGAHIEHYLSHLGDLLALAERSRSKTANINLKTFTSVEFLELYAFIISAIGDTIRYGYSNVDGERIGTAVDPIVEIKHHIRFIKALYSNRSNLMSRTKLTFFTTNYDTLLEDALGMEKFTVVDGFSGGAVGYWNPVQEFQDLNSRADRCLLYKLHGSIDWQHNKDKGIVRARYGTNYMADNAKIMIYPQATKYVETQKDPFSYLFSGFRGALNSLEDNVLITCGYSFGDDHINAEIESALQSRTNRTTLIAFVKENPSQGIIINKTLDSWLISDQFGSRVYGAGEKGLYYNSLLPVPADDGENLTWWKFSGLTNFMTTGDYE